MSVTPFDKNQVISDRLNRLIDEIRDNLERTDQVVTGKTSGSIQLVQVGEAHFKVTGIFPFPRVETGRKGGRVPAGFRFIIRQWAIDKGLFDEGDKDLDSFAYFVSRKIAAVGTWLHRHRSSDAVGYDPADDDGSQNFGGVAFNGEKADVYSTATRSAVADILSAFANEATNYSLVAADMMKIHFE